MPAAALAFAQAALRYWLSVFPRTASELRALRRRAKQIEDPALRQLALQALHKRENIEGAAAFAAFVPRAQRARAIRALISFQAAYNHVDVLAEQPSSDPVGVAQQLHGALPAALDISASGSWQSPAGHRDGGYLAGLVEDCRSALRGLGSYPVVASAAQRSARRIVAFQSLSLAGAEQLERWAETEAIGELEWWESAAAAGSSLTVHALIAAAANRSLSSAEATAIEHAYFPSACALHSLLDSLLDEREDAASGQLSMIACYSSSSHAAARMSLLAGTALELARALPGGPRHALLLTAMACSYLAGPIAPAGGEVARQLRRELGLDARLALLVFYVRRRLARHAEVPYDRGVSAVHMGEEPRREADARAA